MNHTRKMVLVPEDSLPNNTSNVSENELKSQVISNPKPKRIDRDMDKIQKLLKIVLKIALNNGYNEDFTIKDIDGNPISDTDIGALLNHALSHQRLLVGEHDFIRILHEAKVNPSWIVNENIKAKLQYYTKGYQTLSVDQPKSPPHSNMSSPPASPTLPILQPGETALYSTVPKHFTTNPSLKRKIDDIPQNIIENKRPKLPESYKKPWEVPLPDSDDDDNEL